LQIFNSSPLFFRLVKFWAKLASSLNSLLFSVSYFLLAIPGLFKAPLGLDSDTDCANDDRRPSFDDSRGA